MNFMKPCKISTQSDNRISHIIIAERDCGTIQVSEGSSTYKSEHGMYYLSEDKSGPNNPVWKLKDQDRYIFNTGSSKGLRIGKSSALKTGSSYYHSKKWYDHWKIRQGLLSAGQYFITTVINQIYSCL